MRWHLAVAALATFWGFVSVIVAGVTLGPLPLTVYRTGLAALALPVALAVLGRLDLLRVRTLRVPLVLSGAALAAHWWCYFETIKLAGPRSRTSPSTRRRSCSRCSPRWCCPSRGAASRSPRSCPAAAG